MKLAPFQTDLVESLFGPQQLTAGFSIGAGNAKSTLAAALGLAMSQVETDAPQVALVASSGVQATRTLWTPMSTMVTNSVELDDWLVSKTTMGLKSYASAWNDGVIWTLPASDEKLQGLNPSLALLDEGELVDPSVVNALEDRLGKRPEQLVLVFGTPGPDTDCALYQVRTLHANGGAYAFIEYAAPEHLDFHSRRAWHAANPALRAKILSIAALQNAVRNIDAASGETKVRLTNRFKRYRLGLWLPDVSEDTWLPAGAWEACPTAPLPEDGTKVVLAVDGTYKRSTAVVMATMENAALTLLFAGERASDEEVWEVVDEATARYDVTSIVYYPNIRPTMIEGLERKALPMVEWDRTRQEETKCSNALYQAVITKTLTHDGSDLLAQHFNNIAYRDTPNGVLLKRLTKEGAWIDSAMAARMAWWKALPANQNTPSVW